MKDFLKNNGLTILIILTSALFIYYVIIPFLKGLGTGAGTGALIGGGIGGGLLGLGAAGAAGAGVSKLLQNNNSAPSASPGGSEPELNDPFENAGTMFEEASPIAEDMLLL